MQIWTICMRLSQKLPLRKSDKQLAWHLFLACWWRAAWKGKENNQVMLKNYIAKSRDFSLQVFDIGRVRALGLVEYKEGTCDEVLVFLAPNTQEHFVEFVDMQTSSTGHLRNGWHFRLKWQVLERGTLLSCFGTISHIERAPNILTPDSSRR